MKSVIILTLPAFLMVSSWNMLAQSARSASPNGSLSQEDSGNQGGVTRAVQWGKGTGMSRLTRTPHVAENRDVTRQEREAVREDDSPAPSAAGFPNEVVFVQNPGDAAFRK